MVYFFAVISVNRASILSPTEGFGFSAVADTLGAALVEPSELVEAVAADGVLAGLLPTDPINEDASLAAGAVGDVEATAGLAVTEGETAGAGSGDLATSTGFAGAGVSTFAAAGAGAGGSVLVEELAATGSARGIGGGGGGGVLAGLAAATGATDSFVSATATG